MKKVLSLLLALCLVVGMVPLAASAETTSECSDGAECTHAAAIGNTHYDTLAEAFAEAKKLDIATIDLLSDAELDKNIIVEGSDNITLNLNGYSIKPSSSFYFGTNTLFVNRGTLIINGAGTLEGDGEFYPTSAIENSGNLTVNSATIIGASWAIDSKNDSVLQIEGGTFKNTKTASNKEDAAIRLVNNTTAKISGTAKIEGLNTAVRAYGSKLSVSGNAELSGQFGVLLFNNPLNNSKDAISSSFSMEGGSITATSGFALSGNNLQSAGCEATITGGTLEQTSGQTCIYWPMEGELTVGGTAVVEGGSAIEAKMGTITIQGNAQLTGKGSYLDEAPNEGGSQADGSAILVSSQMYGANEGQYIESPALTVNIEGGTLTSTNGNAVTVYNTEATDAQTTDVTVSGGTLTPAEDRAVVQVTNAKSDSTVTSPTENGENYTVETSASNTTVTISSKVAGFAADLENKTGFYNSLSEALDVAGNVGSETTIVLLRDADLSGETGISEKITFVVNPKVTLTLGEGQNFHGTIINNGNVNGSLPEGATMKVHVAFVVSPSNATVTVEGATSEADNGNLFYLDAGETYSYTVSANGYYAKTGTVSVGNSAQSVVVVLSEIVSTPTYTNTVTNTENGKVTVSPAAPKKDDTVTITTTPDKGYKVGSVAVTDADGKTVTVTNAGNGKYTFKQPDSKVTIKVTFVWDNPFTDVGTAWYTNAIQYVYENNLMAGTGDTTFDPEMNLTRAMTAQILYNLEGKPEVTEEATFADMNEAPTWSVDAIAWAQDTGVVAGIGNNKFDPNANVTREQFAQMMYNYAKYKGYDLTKTGDLSKFPDEANISSWAETALSWANGNGLINGHEDTKTIDPQGDTIRAQAASILMNFDLNVVK